MMNHRWWLSNILLISCCYHTTCFAPSYHASPAFTFALAAEYAPAMDDIFTKRLAKQLAGEVQKTAHIPFVPKPVVEYVTTEAIQRVSTDISMSTLEKVRDLLSAATTENKFDDYSVEDRNALAEQVASELNPKIDVPLLDEDQELIVLREIFKVVFACLTTSDAKMQKDLLKKSFQTSRDLLGSDDSRNALIKSLAQSVDIPLLDKQQEKAVIKTAVLASAETLESLLPPEFVEALQGQRPKALFESKAFLVAKLNEKVDIMGLNEEQEKTLLTTMVDLTIDQYINGTDMEFLMLPQEQQKSTLEEKLSILKREVELSRDRYEREQKNLSTRIDRLKQEIKKTKRRGRTFRLFRSKS